MKIGVIVGRFQVPELTEGHKHLISEVTKNFDRVYIFIGCTKNDIPDLRNPLPYDARFIMLVSDPVFDINKTSIHKIIDLGNWPKWVESLDNMINKLLEVDDISGDVFICGSRDSVATRYKEYNGKYEVYDISEVPGISGTLSRNQVEEKDIVWNKESRRAVISIIKKIYEKRDL